MEKYFNWFCRNIYVVYDIVLIKKYVYIKFININSL